MGKMKNSANSIPNFSDNEMLLNLESELARTQHRLDQYKKAYLLMCDETWDLIPDEERHKISKKLEDLVL